MSETTTIANESTTQKLNWADYDPYTEDQETPEVQETPKVQETPEVQETPKVQETKNSDAQLRVKKFKTRRNKSAQNENKTEIQTNSEDISFPVYIIHSAKSMPTVTEILNRFGGYKFLRITRNRYGQENPSYIAILDDRVYQKICDYGYGGPNALQNIPIKVDPYRLDSKNLKERKRSLFIPLPSIVMINDVQLNEFIESKLNLLVDCGIIEEKSYEIRIPLKSREYGWISKGCYIDFKENVPMKRIAMTRLILNDTRWPDVYLSEELESDKIPILRCNWELSKEELKSRRFKSETKSEWKTVTRFKSNYNRRFKPKN